MYPGENPLLNLLNPTNATESKENGQMPVLNPIELLNFFSNRAIIERLYQIRINLEAQVITDIFPSNIIINHNQVLSLQNDIQTMDTQLKEKKKLLSKKQSTPDGVKNDPHEEKSENTEKRTRRKARDVERSHVCPVTSCNKSYGYYHPHFHV